MFIWPIAMAMIKSDAEIRKIETKMIQPNLENSI